jgi:hypothetical protein
MSLRRTSPTPTADAPEAPPPDDHDDELAQLRARLDKLDREAEAAARLSAEERRVRGLSYSDWARELSDAQDLRQGLPARWTEAARERCERLCAVTGWSFPKNAAAPSETNAWLEWVEKRSSALEAYQRAVAAEAQTKDRSHPFSIGLDERRRFTLDQDARKAVRAAEATCRGLGLVR